jgi:P-type E1-E2 ATPase
MTPLKPELGAMLKSQHRYQSPMALDLTMMHLCVGRGSAAAMGELAGIDVLCSDKTGTLTENKLTLGEPFCTAGVSPQEIILAASLASRADSQDPIDLAVLSGLKDGSLDRYKLIHFLPFDPVHKRTEATVESGASEHLPLK